MFKHILMKKKTICVLAGILLVLIVWIVWGNTALELNTYTISSRGLPDAFDSYRIAQVSDLHNAEFGEGNQRLLDMLRKIPVLRSCFLTDRSCLIPMSIMTLIWSSVGTRMVANSGCRLSVGWLRRIRDYFQNMMQGFTRRITQT